LHIEAPPEELVVSGGLFHGVQLWVNLPAANKANPPRYQDIRAAEEVLLASPDGGVLFRVIAGEVAGHRGPGSTFTPMAMIHATVQPGARLELPWDPTFNALAYVLAGEGTVAEERRPVTMGQLAVFGPGDRIQLDASASQDGPSQTLEVILLGGRPIGEPVVHYGPFVMNTRQEIAQAMADYQAGRLGTVPAASVVVHRP
jgi:redox-sensitive bicupin YhaK (pirin superfamily)